MRQKTLAEISGMTPDKTKTFGKFGKKLTLSLGALALLGVAGAGCAAGNAVQGGLESANSGVGTAKSTADTAKQAGGDLKDAADKAMGNKKDGAGGEKKEDEDGKRLQAKATKPNQPVNDEINIPANDPVDWKSYDLSHISTGAWVKFELNWDESAAELNLDIYDQTGKQVVQSPGRSGVPNKNIQLKVDAPGVYYARIYGIGKKDVTVYTVTLRTKGGSLSKPVAVLGKDKDKDAAGAAAAAPGAPGAPGAPPPPGAPGAPAPGAPGAPPGYPAPGAYPGAPGAYPQPGAYPGAPGAYPGAPGAYPGAPAPGPAAPNPAQTADAGGGGDKIPDGAIQGKIVSSFRGDDGSTTLYLNQGSKSKLRVNMTGNILEGSEGGKKLEGGTFTITKVIGDSQSVATTKFGKSLGKNNRFMVIKPK